MSTGGELGAGGPGGEGSLVGADKAHSISL